MGSVGDCYDNAMMDSFYNPRQLHSAFKHLSISHWLPKKRGTLPRDNSVDQVEVRLGLA